MNLKHYFFLFTLLTTCSTAFSQVRISGRVYDKSKKYWLEGVTVMSTSGRATVTDSTGKYTIYINESDSIWFSYQNKPTSKYSIADFPNPHNFEIALHVPVETLQKVFVRPSDYRLDSIRNREEYAKAFNYTKPGLSVSTSPDGGVGLDINELINMFNFARNKRMAAFKERLIREEEEKYIYSRFSRALVIRLTGLRGDDLEKFMVQYKPHVNFIDFATDYELQSYIKRAHVQFLMDKINP